jgi:hypothetical protein
MENLTDDRLLNFLDGNASGAEKEKVRSILDANANMKKRMNDLEAIHTYFQNQARLEYPPKRFTERVMGGLHSKPYFAFISPRNGVMLLIGLIVASGLATMMVSSGSFDQWHTFFSFGQFPLKTNWVRLPTSVPFDLKLIVKLFVVLNVAIGFVLLDRTILRPIFQKRAGLKINSRLQIPN